MEVMRIGFLKYNMCVNNKNLLTEDNKFGMIVKNPNKHNSKHKNI